MFSLTWYHEVTHGAYISLSSGHTIANMFIPAKTTEPKAKLGKISG